jgi:diguanylate cyclase (GGDEF)-like protein
MVVMRSTLEPLRTQLARLRPRTTAAASAAPRPSFALWVEQHALLLRALAALALAGMALTLAALIAEIAGARDGLAAIVALSAVVLGVAGATALVWLMRPITRLVRFAASVGTDVATPTRAPDDAPGEARVLGQAYNRLLDRLHERERALARELAERTDAQARLSLAAHQDPVTELHNRQYFQQAVERSLAARRGGAQVAVMFIDLDDFKRVNDVHGHALGDGVLREVSRRITTTLRKSDTVCRLGGDEFAVILTVAGGADEAVSVAAKLLAALALPMRVSGHDVFVGASIGIALAVPGEVDPVEMLRRADLAMYQAKSELKGGYRIYEERVTARASRRAQLAQRLRGALASDSPTLVYQPQVELRGHRITRLEALLRWRDEELGHVTPVELVRLAEETGTIQTLGERVLEQACRDARWLAQRCGLAIPVAVNVSGRQVAQADFADRVEDLLARYALHGEMLELEITDAGLLTDWGAAERQLGQLRQGGVQLSIDDFGHGFAALRALRQLPPQRIKFDCRASVGPAGDPTEEAIAAATVSLARQLGIESVAKCVETRAQLDVVTVLGCDAAQGHVFRQPADIETMAGWLLENAGRVRP